METNGAVKAIKEGTKKKAPEIIDKSREITGNMRRALGLEKPSFTERAKPYIIGAGIVAAFAAFIKAVFLPKKN